jgi:hypothetical protein
MGRGAEIKKETGSKRKGKGREDRQARRDRVVGCLKNTQGF